MLTAPFSLDFRREGGAGEEVSAGTVVLGLRFFAQEDFICTAHERHVAGEFPSVVAVMQEQVVADPVPRQLEEDRSVFFEFSGGEWVRVLKAEHPVGFVADDQVLFDQIGVGRRKDDARPDRTACRG